jgi:hypothetical protein
MYALSGWFIVVEFLWFAGGACAMLAALIILAPSHEPAARASQRALAPMASDLGLVVRAQALEEEFNRLKDELAPWTAMERTAAVLLMAGAAAQRVKIGHIDHAALKQLVAGQLATHLPAAASARFDQLLAQPPPLQVIASVAVKESVLEAATAVIQKVLGPDWVAWSPAARDLFNEWPRGFQHAETQVCAV